MTFNDEPDRQSAWSADGESILYDKFFDVIYATRIDGSGVEELIKEAAAYPTTAPHGTKLAASDQRGGGLLLMRID